MFHSLVNDPRSCDMVSRRGGITCKHQAAGENMLVRGMPVGRVNRCFSSKVVKSNDQL